MKGVEEKRFRERLSQPRLLFGSARKQQKKKKKKEEKSSVEKKTHQSDLDRRGDDARERAVPRERGRGGGLLLLL